MKAADPNANANQKPHASLGASSASRWINCPGSIRLSSGLAKTTSKYAEEGTAAHALAEMCLRYESDPRAGVGTPIVVNGVSTMVTEEMADAVWIYLNAIRDWKSTLSPTTQTYIETKFNLGWMGREDLFGTNDAMLAEPFGQLVVFDFKYGAGVAVEAKGNPQLRYYALGAMADMAFETVTLVIVQPRAHYADGPVRYDTMDAQDLVAWGKTVLIPAAEATEKPDAPLRIGGWCKFCPALALCPRHHENALAVAKEVFAPSSPSSLPAPELMPVSTLRDVIDKAPVVEAWLNACREHVRFGLENGTVKSDDVGYKLVPGRATRKWADEEAAEVYLVQRLGNSAYAPRKLLTPAQAEKAVGKDEASALAAMIETSRGVQIAPLSDPRPAVDPVALVFSPVDGEVKE